MGTGGINKTKIPKKSKQKRKAKQYSADQLEWINILLPVKINDELLEKAWQMRKIGIYSMREIAQRLKVNREELIQELTEYLKKQENIG